MELTGIRQKVFLDRYALKDEAGAAVEKTPEEMWRRVAHAIAQVEPKGEREHWENKFYQAMEDFVLVPGGRILSGAGTGYKVTFYNCLPPHQEVLTPTGYKPIKDVKEGDAVITGKKRARRVNRVFIRETEEPLCVIRPTKLGFDDVRVTGEHPILAIKQEWVNRHRSRDGLHLKNTPQWIKAAELAKGDFVAVAWNQEICGLTKLHLRDYLPETFVSDGAVVTKSYLKKPVKEEIDIDEQFMLLAGTWLGDGCVTHRTGTDIPAGIQITFNKGQKKWAEEIAYILQEKFTVVPTVREDRWGQRLIQVRVESYPVGLFFKNFFGAYSYKKKIPQVLMEQPRERILPLIKGMFRADGYLSENDLGIALSNKHLAVQLHQLLLRTGRFFTIFQNNAKGGRHDTYRVTAGVSQANGLCEYIYGEKKANVHHDQDYFLAHEDLFWVRIDAIDTVQYKGKVYDLEVEEDHSFITGGIVVSNCFVIPAPHDSRQGILNTLSQMVEIMSRGGGVGINLSSLRPRGARVKKVNGFSSGPCNWAELFSVATKDIIQQGGSRRGALMIMLWDWHPDIAEFITVKQDLTRINGANLSVCVSDAFMEAVKADADWDLVFPDKDDPEYDEKWDGYLPNWKALGKKVIVKKTIKARELWDTIAKAAWQSAEPGVVFMERYNKWFNNYYWEYVNCVNPCGEEGLPNWGVCNLTSINLAALVNDEGEMDYARLAEVARVGVRFQDNVIDADVYVFPEIKKRQVEGERRIGLGTMGLGDALIKMSLRYGSEESLPVIDKIYKTIRDAAYEASVAIAAEKGAFPGIDIKKHLEGYFIKQLPEDIRKKMKKVGVRNSVLLQQAPTGSISLMAGVSSGIEPVYEFELIRRDRLGEHVLRHPLYDAWYAAFTAREGREPTKEDRPNYFVSANDLTPEDHVYAQATIQKYVDASISKTVNAPKAHTVEDVKRLYMLAYDMGCKGITYMRAESRPGVLTRMDEDKQNKQESQKQDEVKVEGQYVPEVKPRPMVAHGSTYQVETPVGQAYITINTNGGRQPMEVFINVGKAGSDVTAMAEAMGRLISLTLRLASPVTPIERVHKVAAELIGIGGARSLGFGENRVRSLPDAVAKVIDRHFGFFTKHKLTDTDQPKTAITNGQTNGHTEAPVAQKEESPDPVAYQRALAQERVVTVDLCPNCGEGSLVFEESCKKCYSCGYSEC